MNLPQPLAGNGVVGGAQDAAAPTLDASRQRSARRWSDGFARVAPPLVGAILLIVLWQAVTTITEADPWLLPGPLAVAQETLGQVPRLMPEVAATLQLVVVGFVLGTAIGLLTAAVLHNVTLLNRAVYPLLIVSQNVPMIALAPLLVIWFGFGAAPKLIIIVLWCFFPVAIAALSGFRTVDRSMVDYLQMSGARRLQVFRYLELPAAAPSIASGFKISATYAVLGAIAGEWLGSSAGLGHYMLLQKTAFRADRMFVAILTIIVLSLLLVGAIMLVERWILRWRFAGGR